MHLKQGTARLSNLGQQQLEGYSSNIPSGLRFTVIKEGHGKTEQDASSLESHTKHSQEKIRIPCLNNYFTQGSEISQPGKAKLNRTALLPWILGVI